MEGRVAMVTGSLSGIGLGVARCLGQHGCRLLLTDHPAVPNGSQVLAELKSLFPGRVEHVPADLADRGQVQQLCAQADALYPQGIHVLVNVAGVQHVSPVEDYPDEKWDLMMAVTLTAPFLLIRHFLPAMKTRGWGRIINISSMMAVISAPGKAPYSASKAGVVGLTKGVALEAARFGVTCNAVCPGFVEAPIFQKQLALLAEQKGISYEQARDDYCRENVPNGKLMKIEEVASMVYFLCTEDAVNMNGSALLMDAGFTSR